MGLEAFDLAGYLRARAPDARPTGADAEWVLRCPRCGGVEHLYVNVAKRCGHCFRCGWSPGAVDLVAALDGVPRAQAAARVFGPGAQEGRTVLAELEELRQRVRGAGARTARASEAAPEIELPTAYLSLSVQHDLQTEVSLAPYRAYLARRRVPEARIARHQIGCALVGRYTGRVILPVHLDGRVVAFQARDITGRSKAKYLGPPGARLGDALFNLDAARRFPSIVVCEGIISAICAGENAVASFGKALKPNQVALLVEAARPVTILFDSAKAETGAAAGMAAGAAVEMLGGTPSQCGHAVALAQQGTLGLVCDPLGGLVELPCVFRNATGSAIALAAIEMALAGIEFAIPADEVIDTMGQIGREMDVRYRETAGGGLAATPTGRRLARERLYQLKKS